MNIFTASEIRVFIMVAAVASISSAPLAQSQEVDTSQWSCEFCPFASGHTADYELGATNVSDDSAYFGDASGYAEAGVYANVDGDGAYSGNSHQIRWTVEDLGLDSRSVELAGGRQGIFDYGVSYRQLPRTRFFTTDTIFSQSAPNALSLPAGWVRAPVTSGFTELDTNLAARDIKNERRDFEIGGKYRAPGRFTVSANYRRQERDGLDVYGGAYFNQASLLPGPFEYVTDIVDLGIGYTGDNGFLSLDYYASDFHNNDNELRWESPFTTAVGAETAAIARPPDNQFQQLSLSGNYRFPNYRTVIAYTAAIGQMEQDASFLPYTTNDNLNVAPLPKSGLNGEVDTSNFAFSLTSRVHRKARLKLAYRYDERDNQTAQEDWTRVIADSFLSGETEQNTPYSFKRSTFKLSGDLDLLETVRVSAGYDRKNIDRDFQEVAEQTEDIGWGRLRWRPNQAYEVIVRGGASERDIDRYNEIVASSLGQNPLMRKYNLAYRYRRFGDLTLSASWPDSPVSLRIDGSYADDKYTQSLLGVTAGDDLRIAADLNWALSDNASLYVNGGYENIQSEKFGSEQFSTSDWRATYNDDFYNAGAGFRVRQIGGKFDLQVDYTHSDGTSEINLGSASSGLSRFPDLKSTLDYLRLQLSYRRSDRLEFRANIRYQSFSAEDWALEGVEPATIPVVLSLGAKPYDDQVLILGLGFRYLIGAPKETRTE